MCPTEARLFRGKDATKEGADGYCVKCFKKRTTDEQVGYARAGKAQCGGCGGGGVCPVEATYFSESDSTAKGYCKDCFAKRETELEPLGYASRNKRKRG